ncbi:MAG: hypothetical protein K6E53_12095 [Lachnospiraceae bacterium]|nr:hypothetical protein [Lachnospiraceae bacterium]
MLFVILNWVYILITSFITGFFVLCRIKSITGIFPEKKEHVGSCIICGICVLTAYAGYFSLFGGVGLSTNIILVIFCLISFVFERAELKKITDDIAGIGSNKGDYKHSILLPVFWAISLSVIIVCAYFTSCGRFAYDTGTYHAQSIHWIESYGVVKGLAHMQTRLGFNSSYFCLCALYSMHFLGRSMHAVSGFLAVFVMLYSLHGWFRHYVSYLSVKDPKYKDGIKVSDFLYFAPYAYFVITAIEIISPSTDHGVIWLIIWLCIRWAELTEEEHAAGNAVVNISEYALLCVMAVFLVSIKLSVGILAVLVIKPAYILIKNKQIKSVVFYVLAGIVLILPYFIRNVIISGWLVYPLPSVDLFGVDWKVPVEGARHEADEIVVWARYTKDTALIDQKINEWFPVWWSEQGTANRYLSLSSFTGAGITGVIIICSCIYRLYLYLNAKKGRLLYVSDELSRHFGYVYFGAVLLASFIFFMLSAPSNRFGYGYILMLPLYAAGVITVFVQNVIKHKKRAVFKWCMGPVIALIVCLDMIKGIYMFASDDAHYFLDAGMKNTAILQKDYPEAKSVKREWEGLTIYCPEVDGEQIWYYAFPAILYGSNLDGVERRGNKIKDGFRLK